MGSQTSISAGHVNIAAYNWDIYGLTVRTTHDGENLARVDFLVLSGTFDVGAGLTFLLRLRIEHDSRSGFGDAEKMN